MLDILLYSLLNFAIAFTANIQDVLSRLRRLRHRDGRGCGGIGASLSLETIPNKARGFVSGLLQSGYPTGYLVASLVYGFLYATIGWRGMFMVGVIPAFILIFYIFLKVPESQHFSPDRARSKEASTLYVLRHHGQAGAVRHHPDDRLQFLQPRHPGPLSHPSCRCSTISIRRR